jgi:hypothetical protein
MEAKTIHSSNISFVEVLAALVEFFTLCALFFIQGITKTAKTTERAARIAWRWLNTRHLFGDDSEAVTLTGWQYLGVAAVAIVCGLLFSIKF